MRVARMVGISLAVVGLGACLTLGACGGEEPAAPVPPVDEAPVARLQVKHNHCDVFGSVSGAVIRRVRITVSHYCGDTGCGASVPSPTSTTTNAAGEFGLSGPSVLNREFYGTYVVTAEKDGFTFDGPFIRRCTGDPIGPVQFVATPVAGQ